MIDVEHLYQWKNQKNRIGRYLEKNFSLARMCSQPNQCYWLPINRAGDNHSNSNRKSRFDFSTAWTYKTRSSCPDVSHALFPAVKLNLD